MKYGADPAGPTSPGPMAERYDCVVVGCGIAGAAATYELARTGVRCLTLEQFEPGHARGSSHGESRIYRTAYAEGPLYVPLAQRAVEGWRRLQAITSEPVMRTTGGLYVGPRDGALVRGALESASRFSLPHRLLSAAQLAEEFPAFHPTDGEVGVSDPNAGVLLAEACLRQFVRAARELGATIRPATSATSWRVARGSVSVEASGERFIADHLVLAVGAWTPQLVPELAPHLRLERQVPFWFTPRREPEQFLPSTMPVFVWDVPGHRAYYGIPDLGDGVKVATEDGRVVARPEEALEAPSATDAAKLEPFVRRAFPGLDVPARRAVTCLYTNAPDHRFLLGAHPRHPEVVVASACSGHGFKFAPVVGEAVAQLVTTGTAGPELAPFDPARFGAGPTAGPGR